VSPADFQAFCLRLPGATLSVQWGDSHVFKVGGKMFAVLAGGVGGEGWSCKVSDIAYEALTDGGPAKPAPYLARAKWAAFDSLEALSDDETRGLVANAHAIVSAKLTKAVRKELGLT
jgi:predicted DNA-binding protein (MmcQ/YjbR family)